MFTVGERNAVHDRVLELASSDPRVVAAAAVGSLALDGGDRWSDLDLTFAVADEIPMGEVLGDWTEQLVAELDAVVLFDLPSGATIYRVFLLPGCLQVDLSFTPAAAFALRGPKFKLLFGSADERSPASLRPAGEILGYAVHHAVRARFSIERDRFWQAEYWISGLRDEALVLACRRRGLEGSHARGFDELPTDTLSAFRTTLVRSLDRDELLRALQASVDALLREADEVRDLAEAVEPRLRELAVASGG